MQNLINKIHLGDSLEIMKKIPDNSIDLIVTDCPYKIIAGGVRIKYKSDECSGVLNKRKQTIKNDPKGCLSRGSVVYADNAIGKKWKKLKGDPCAVKNGKMFEHNDLKFEEWLPDLYRVLKKGTHCYIMINSRNLAELQHKAEEVGFVFQNLLIWNKGNLTPNKYYMQGAEFILLLSKRPARNINNMGTSNIITVKNNIGKKEHPTEKGEQLLKVFISNSSNRGDIVLDPFAGSGSTISTCINLDRQYIGIEIDEKYYKIACNRRDRAIGKVGLFK